MKHWIILALLITAMLLCGCGVKEKPQLEELQVTACNSADSHQTCAKLPDLDLVTAEDCCAALGKCCP
ncbi:hypothetical protein FJZ53_00640 [Candidatus Woesearchaeota archaeon]|nr:hypothetical protein [Candidatus Woesearchaeota archaeon]